MAALFEQVKQEVSSAIRSGTYKVGEVLPSVEEIAAQVDCSPGTVRRALTELAQTGVVKRVRRRGTVIVRQPSLGRVCLLLGREPHTNLLLQDVLYERLAAAGYEVDMVPTSVVGLDELLLRCESLQRGPDPVRVLVAIEPLWDNGATVARQVAAIFALFAQKVVFAFSSTQQYPGVAQVSPDHQVVAREVVKHLLGLGHRRIGLLAGAYPGERSWVAESAQHALHMLEVAGAEGVCHYLRDGGEVAVVERIQQEGLTAFWCITDHQAVMLLNACHRAGLRVPGDVSIVGRHDTPWSRECTPQLTSVSINPRGMAEAVLSLLAEQSGGEETEAGPWVKLVEAELKARGTTGPAPQR